MEKNTKIMIGILALIIVVSLLNANLGVTTKAVESMDVSERGWLARLFNLGEDELIVDTSSEEIIPLEETELISFETEDLIPCNPM